MEIYPRPGILPRRPAPEIPPDVWVEQIEFAIALALQLAIAIVAVSALVRGQLLVGFAGVLILILTFAPAIIERQLNIQLPIEITLITSVFLFASFYLGEVRDFYERFWWWDLVLHGTSALLIGIVGFISVYSFYMTRRVQVAPVYIACITFALAVTVGTLWEIFEFVMDRYLGLNMQRSGLVDTMTDLIINAFGALVAAITAFMFVRGGDHDGARRIIRRFAKRKRDSQEGAGH